MIRARTNQPTTRDISLRPDTFEAFDRLPPLVRQRMCNMINNVASTHVLQHMMRGMPVSAVLRNLDHTDQVHREVYRREMAEATAR